MKWLSKNWKIILIAVNIAILVMVSIMFWFYTDAYLIWNPDNFNNIASPVVGIISIYFIYKAFMETVKQSRISLSLTIKPYFEEKFNRIKSNMERDDRLPIYAGNKITPKDLFSVIFSIYSAITQDDQYKIDLEESRLDRLQHSNYFMSRRYNMFLEFFSNLSVDPLWDYQASQELITEINDSKLIEEEKVLFRKRIKESLVGNYIKFFDSNDRDTSIYTMPLIKYPNDKNLIPFGQFHRTEFRRYYDFFKRELDQ